MCYNDFNNMIFIKSEYVNKIIPLISEAKTNIDIAVYQWNYYSYMSNTPIQKLSLAIKDACCRGLSVRVLLHSGSPSDHLLRVNSQMGSRLTSWGAKVKFYKKGGILHTKMILLDKRIAVIGSHNFSKRSMSSNIEVSALVDNGEDIRRLLEYYEVLWSQC